MARSFLNRFSDSGSTFDRIRSNRISRKKGAGSIGLSSATLEWHRISGWKDIRSFVYIHTIPFRTEWNEETWQFFRFFLTKKFFTFFWFSVVALSTYFSCWINVGNFCCKEDLYVFVFSFFRCCVGYSRYRYVFLLLDFLLSSPMPGIAKIYQHNLRLFVITRKVADSVHFFPWVYVYFHVVRY